MSSSALALPADGSDERNFAVIFSPETSSYDANVHKFFLELKRRGRDTDLESKLMEILARDGLDIRLRREIEGTLPKIGGVKYLKVIIDHVAKEFDGKDLDEKDWNFYNDVLAVRNLLWDNSSSNERVVRPIIRDSLLAQIQRNSLASRQEKIAVMKLLALNGESDWPGLMDSIVPYLKSEDPQLVKAALYVVGFVATDSLRWQDLKGLPEGLHPQFAVVAPLLLDLMNSGNDEIEAAAISAISGFGDLEPAAKTFREKLEKTPLSQIKTVQALIIALSHQLRDKDAIPVLLDIFKRDKEKRFLLDIRLGLYLLRGGKFELDWENPREILKNMRASVKVKADLTLARCSNLLARLNPLRALR